MIFIYLFSIGQLVHAENFIDLLNTWSSWGDYSFTNVDKLPTFNINPELVTLSGFSSGGAFAQMMQISHSSLIQGVAVFSQTYYRCGPPSGKVDEFDKYCTKLFNLTEAQYYNPELVHRDIATYFERKLIDNPKNLQGKPLYVFAGLGNFLFNPIQILRILDIYERYIQNPDKIKTRVVADAEHLVPTANNKFGGPCGKYANSTAFIGNCGFSGAFEALEHLLTPNIQLKYPNDNNNNGASLLTTGLREFDQTEFTRGVSMPQLDSKGYYFVPSSCANGKKKCLLHLYFHGCLTGREFLGRDHIENIGFLEVAERNGIIIIFPQAASSLPENELGCWDSFGISGPLYATKIGDQITAVKRMLDRAIGTEHVKLHSSSY